MSMLRAVQLARHKLIRYVAGEPWFKGFEIALTPNGWVIKVRVDAMSINKAKSVVPESMEGHPVLVVPASHTVFDK